MKLTKVPFRLLGAALNCNFQILYLNISFFLPIKGRMDRAPSDFHALANVNYTCGLS